MKILSIGNSFSQDAHRHLCALAAQYGLSVEAVNLYLGACSLQTHWQNILLDEAAYDLEINGNWGEGKCSILKALQREPWDVITLQQVSHLSGQAESYESYLTEIIAYLRTHCPKATLYFHQTWAYETDYSKDGFAAYGWDQKTMFEAINAVSSQMEKRFDGRILPVGAAIQALREKGSAFDYSSGGLSLCRDGLHLSLDYGRFAAAAVWLHTLFGQELSPLPFEDLEMEKIMQIIEIVNKI